MGKGVELNYDDLLRASRPPEPGPGAVEDDDGGNVSDLLATVRQFNQEVQQTMTQFRELLSLAATVRGGAFPGMRGVGAGMGGQAAAPQPTAQPGADPKAQVLAGLEAIKAQCGDVTLVELVNILATQYGGLHLSDIISRIK